MQAVTSRLRVADHFVRGFFPLKMILDLSSNKTFHHADVQEGNVRFLPGHEDIFPGTFYVLTAAFAGLVFSSRCKREHVLFFFFHILVHLAKHFPSLLALAFFLLTANILVKATAPILFGVTAFAFTFPRSTDTLITRAETSTGLTRPTVDGIFGWAKETANHRYDALKKVVTGKHPFPILLFLFFFFQPSSLSRCSLGFHREEQGGRSQGSAQGRRKSRMKIKLGRFCFLESAQAGMDRGNKLIQTTTTSVHGSILFHRFLVQGFSVGLSDLHIHISRPLSSVEEHIGRRGLQGMGWWSDRAKTQAKGGKEQTTFTLEASTLRTDESSKLYQFLSKSFFA